MAKDPVCDMEVPEEGAQFLVHVEHKNYYFCSEACKQTFEEQIGLTRPEVKGGRWKRFLVWLAGGAEKEFGGEPPKCH